MGIGRWASTCYKVVLLRRKPKTHQYTPSSSAGSVSLVFSSKVDCHQASLLGRSINWHNELTVTTVHRYRHANRSGVTKVVHSTRRMWAGG